MLRIEINGTFLDLAPGTATQVERQSPFFELDSLADEYSLPLTLLYTPNNAKALGLPNHFYTRRQKLRIAAKLYDDLNFAYAGELVVQAASLNMNDVTRSSITAYFLTGVSQFFSLVKGKRLQDLQLGGVRHFAWTNADPQSPARGFWQVVHQSLAGGMEYSFAPIRNAKWAGSTEEGTPDWMNKPDAAGGLDVTANYNTLAPQVRLKYVLECIFTGHGWTLDSTAMAGTYWDALFMLSFYAVTWQKMVQTADDPFFDFVPLAEVAMNLQNHVPPDYPIANLIIGLRMRYNWGFSFDAASKVCRMFPLKDLAFGRRKSWTKYMGADWEFDFSEDEKIFSFTNEVDGADGLGSAPDLDKVQLGTPVVSYTALPAPTEALHSVVVYCWKEAQYWQCSYNEEDRVYYWAHFSDDIYNLEPAGHNEEIATDISTMPMYRTLWRTGGGDYYALFPLCEQEGNWEGKQGEKVPWTVRLLFHRGWVWEAGPAGFKGQLQYPCLTSLAATITQEEPDLPWSNIYKHELEGSDKGIVPYWWRQSLEYMSKGEKGTGTLRLPRTELMQFQWDDIIILNNLAFLVEGMTDVIPYSGEVKVVVRRIG